MTKFILENRQALVEQFAEMMCVEWTELHSLCRWEDYFEDILKLVKHI